MPIRASPTDAAPPPASRSGGLVSPASPTLAPPRLPHRARSRRSLPRLEEPCLPRPNRPRLSTPCLSLPRRACRAEVLPAMPRQTGPNKGMPRPAYHCLAQPWQAKPARPARAMPSPGTAYACDACRAAPSLAASGRASDRPPVTRLPRHLAERCVACLRPVPLACRANPINAGPSVDQRLPAPLCLPFRAGRWLAGMRRANARPFLPCLPALAVPFAAMPVPA